ncbi:hypothetical protein CC80DRAFT_186051 [Byssothecium circinans]|uniref:Secreted protein n=1 Tax=Byssothecium circinans TaxID=147558 RepID=A0A6A5TG38_9PLEO|nr:hypothetical protein CC80DRAFT_186051 [Byssothecium circinans]
MIYCLVCGSLLCLSTSSLQRTAPAPSVIRSRIRSVSSSIPHDNRRLKRIKSATVTFVVHLWKWKATVAACASSQALIGYFLIPCADPFYHR